MTAFKLADQGLKIEEDVVIASILPRSLGPAARRRYHVLGRSWLPA